MRFVHLEKSLRFPFSATKAPDGRGGPAITIRRVRRTCGKEAGRPIIWEWHLATSDLCSSVRSLRWSSQDAGGIVPHGTLAG
ncbi:hypothetical protein SKAU_G00336260 [Synaphobranchus kaupii]|uniref:Uncharacterized protein n=1 Tax=Synaphobranchus kaupii TaxID=118154 RepID=A0A9Q1EMA7_SYNKA|nr:hypothetical protein SKAU_G00336260 [Synaphobranchus kaupii]